MDAMFWHDVEIVKLFIKCHMAFQMDGNYKLAN